METTRVFAKTLKAWNDENIRIIINKGGTRSSKTFSALQLFALIAHIDKKPRIFSVITQTFPQLRQGAMRDFGYIIKDFSYKENKTAHTIEIGNSLIEFFSADQYIKVLGAQRDVALINECNRLNYEVVRQIMVRTSEKVLFDYNPVADFWINSEIISKRKDCSLITSTYKDNPFISEAQVKEIESNKHNENWWRVYGLGLEGRLEGLVFPHFDLVDAMPQGCKIRYGLDFGMNDPTALVCVGVLGDELYLDELCYSKNLISSDIANIFSNIGLRRRETKIVCDSEGTEQIETLFRDGWNVHAAKKGKGSVIGGIDLMKRYKKIHITKNSTNLINEFYNYTWATDKNGGLLNIPVDKFNHAIDACRYALSDLVHNSGVYSVGFAR